jgi:hypothetical protein
VKLYAGVPLAERCAHERDPFWVRLAGVLSQPAALPGVNVAALLQRVGLNASDTSERVGTAAIAYAAHKALSPIRFPPTVALTPVVARWLGRKDKAAGGTDAS